MTTKCGNMTKKWIVFESSHHFFIGDECTDRHATAHSFGTNDHVWHNLKMLKCPEFSCPTKATLNFIQNQQSPGFITFFPKCFEIFFCGNFDTGFTLDGLYDDSSCFMIDKFEVFKNSIPNIADSGEERSIGSFKDFISSYAQSAMRTPMIGIHTGN